MIIRVAKSDDRWTMAAILVENGYKVSIVKIKVGKTTKSALKVEEGEQE